MVVVSREELNRGSYFLAVPFTTAHLERRKELPNCVPFEAGDFGLPKKCVAQAEALTQLRKSNLSEPREKIGTLSSEALAEVIDAVGDVLDAICEPIPRD